MFTTQAGEGVKVVVSAGGGEVMVEGVVVMFVACVHDTGGMEGGMRAAVGVDTQVEVDGSL